jgi:hypothetical protein
MLEVAKREEFNQHRWEMALEDTLGTKPDDWVKWYRYYRQRRIQARKTLKENQENPDVTLDNEEYRAELRQEIADQTENIRELKARMSTSLE